MDFVWDFKSGAPAQVFFSMETTKRDEAPDSGKTLATGSGFGTGDFGMFHPPDLSRGCSSRDWSGIP